MKSDKKIAIDISAYLSRAFFINIFDVLRNIITARLLGPYLTGLFLSFLTIPQISAYFGLGLTNTLTVLVPSTDKERSRLNAKRDLIFSYTVYMSLIFWLIVLVYLAFFPFKENQLNIFAVCAGCLVLLWHLKAFFLYNYEGEKKFTKLSLLEFLFALVTMILSIWLIYVFKGYGFWLGLIISYALYLIYCFYDYEKENKLCLVAIDFKEIFRMVPLGLVMRISSVVHTPFIILAKLFITFFVGIQEMGFFVLSIVIISKISIIPETVAAVFMPHIASMRAKAENPDRIYNLFIKVQAMTLLIMVFTVILGFVFLKPVVKIILPDYIDGIQAAKIILVAAVPYCLIFNANNVLIATGRKREYLRILATALCIQIIFFAGLMFYKVTIINISISFLATFLIYAFLVNFSIFHSKNRRISIRYASETSDII